MLLLMQFAEGNDIFSTFWNGLVWFIIGYIAFCILVVIGQIAFMFITCQTREENEDADRASTIKRGIINFLRNIRF